MPLLTFDPALGKVDDIRNNLSAIVPQGPHLWLGGDEGTMLERLTRGADGNFSSHRRFELETLLDLPVKGPKRPEIDLEGLDFDGGYLWLTGSHSWKRKKPKGESPEDDLARLTEKPTAEKNRFTLGRIPLVANGADFEPAARSADGKLSAARLASAESGNELTEAIAADAALKPFLAIPSKENGLDIEGLAVRGNRVWVGCRGPVLRGIALVIEIEVRERATGVLELAPMGGVRIRRHFLDLGGLGVRDLAVQGSDLLVLAGPTMVLDGPVAVFRWRKALDRNRESFVGAEGLTRVLTPAFGERSEHAEGLALVPGSGDPGRVFVCYDSPGRERAPKGASSVIVDEVPLLG